MTIEEIDEGITTRKQIIRRAKDEIRELKAHRVKVEAEQQSVKPDPPAEEKK